MYMYSSTVNVILAQKNPKLYHSGSIVALYFQGSICTQVCVHFFFFTGTHNS